jgi:large conductance mechanosensitive channel
MRGALEKFAMKRGAVNLAGGIVIGVAFGAIATVLVNDIIVSGSIASGSIVPGSAAAAAGPDLSDYYFGLSSKVQRLLTFADAKKQGAVFGWVQLLIVALSLLIAAWVLFVSIKDISKRKTEQPVARAAELAPQVKLLSEIRLAAQSKGRRDQCGSVVDQMKSRNLDDSLAERRELAEEVRYVRNMHDLATMNVRLLNQVMNKLAGNGGRLPVSLNVEG